MKIWMMVCTIVGISLTLLCAEESRDTVQAEILKHLDEVEKARAEAIAALEDTVKAVEAARTKAGETRGMDDTHIQIAEAKGVAKIAESTALVELAKVDAKKRIAKAVDRVERLDGKPLPEEQLKQARTAAMKEIAAAIAQVEVTKAKATKTILAVTGEVETTKLLPPKHYVDEAAAVTIAKNNAAVRIAKAVSAVEIAKAASRVELSQALDPEALNMLPSATQETELRAIEEKAKAIISSAMARVEVARANALAEIARAVSAVEVARAVAQKKSTSAHQISVQGSSYPRKLIHVKK